MSANSRWDLIRGLKGKLQTYTKHATFLFRVYRHYRTHSSSYQTAYIAACKRYNTITAYTTVSLKMNPRVRNM